MHILKYRQYIKNNVSTICQGTWRATADNARLYFEGDQDNKRIGAWCANDRDNQWLKVDLGKTKRIRAMATQGNKTVIKGTNNHNLKMKIIN